MIVSRSDESATIANGMVAGTVPGYRHHRFRRRRNSTEITAYRRFANPTEPELLLSDEGAEIAPGIRLAAQFLIAPHDQSHYSCHSNHHFSLLDRDKTATQIPPLAE
jgi:hypothetical protein